MSINIYDFNGDKIEDGDTILIAYRSNELLVGKVTRRTDCTMYYVCWNSTNRTWGCLESSILYRLKDGRVPNHLPSQKLSNTAYSLNGVIKN